MPDTPPDRPAFPSGSLDLVLLSLIAREPAHGYRLARLIEEVSGGTLGIEEGSLYPALQRLRKKKFVDAKWQQQESGRQVRVYSIAPAGASALRQGIDEWATVTRAIAKFLDKMDGGRRVRLA